MRWNFKTTPTQADNSIETIVRLKIRLIKEIIYWFPVLVQVEPANELALSIKDTAA